MAKQGRRSGGKNYSRSEVLELLHTLKAILPVGPEEWAQVAQIHKDNFPDTDRSVQNLCRKYNDLYCKKIPAGDPNCPKEVKLAKKVKWWIKGKEGVGDGQEPYEMETGYQNNTEDNGYIHSEDDDDNDDDDSDDDIIPLIVPLSQPLFENKLQEEELHGANPKKHKNNKKAHQNSVGCRIGVSGRRRSVRKDADRVRRNKTYQQATHQEEQETTDRKYSDDRAIIQSRRAVGKYKKDLPRSRRKQVWNGRKREANGTCCLGLVAISVSMAFGLTSSVVYKWLKFSRKVLLFVLQKHPKAMVKAPTEEEVEEYIAVIVWAATDGLKVKIQHLLDWLVQSYFYNSWVSDTYVNSVFAFAPDGRIRICNYNYPDSWHNSTTIADPGVYDKIEELFVKFQAMVCVDSTFRVTTGRLHCLVQSLQTDPDTPEAIMLNREATSLCQLSEWGMCMIQGQFLRLKDKLLLKTFGDRKVTMNLVILLYNYQTSTIGHNQILNVFNHETDGYFSYANEPTEDATSMFE
eukprot:jgi/Psemu1/41848/gm1.41848_g